jgi:hypothetical protein
MDGEDISHLEVPEDIQTDISAFNDFTLRCFEHIYKTGNVLWTNEGTQTCVDVALEVAKEYKTTNDPLNYYTNEDGEPFVMEGYEVDTDGYYRRLRSNIRTPVDIVTYLLYGHATVDKAGRYCSRDGELVECLDSVIDVMASYVGTHDSYNRAFNRLFTDSERDGYYAHLSYGLDLASARCTSRNNSDVTISCFEKILEYPSLVPVATWRHDQLRGLLLNRHNDYITPHCHDGETPISCFDKVVAQYPEQVKEVLKRSDTMPFFGTPERVVGKDGIPISGLQWVLENYRHYMEDILGHVNLHEDTPLCKRADGTSITCFEKILDIVNSPPREYVASNMTLSRDFARLVWRYRSPERRYTPTAKLCRDADGGVIHCFDKIIEIPSKYSKLKDTLLAYPYDYRRLSCSNGDGETVLCLDKMIGLLSGVDTFLETDNARTLLLEPLCHDMRGNVTTCLDKLIQTYNEYLEAKVGLDESEALLERMVECANSGDEECRSMLPSYRAQIRDMKSGPWASSTIDMGDILRQLLEDSKLNLVDARCSQYYGRDSGTVSCFEKIIQLYEEYPQFISLSGATAALSYDATSLERYECENAYGQRVSCLQRIFDAIFAMREMGGERREESTALVYDFVENNDLTKRNFVLGGTDEYVTGLEYILTLTGGEIDSQLATMLLVKGTVPETLTIGDMAIPLRQLCCEHASMEEVQRYIKRSRIVAPEKSEEAIVLEVVGRCLCGDLSGKDSRICHDTLLWDWANVDKHPWVKPDDPDWGMTNLSDPYGICGVYDVVHTFKADDVVNRYLDKVRAAGRVIQECELNGQIIQHDGKDYTVRFDVYVPTVREIQTNSAEPLIIMHLIESIDGDDTVVKTVKYTFNSVIARRSKVPALKKIPTIRELINGVATGKPSNKKQNLKLVISRRPYDMMRASTGQHWSSCFNVKNGIHAKSIGVYMNYDVYIAYLVSDEFDPVWKSRAWLIPRVDVDTGNFADCFVVQKVYGLPEYESLMRDGINMVLYQAGYTCRGRSRATTDWGWVYDIESAQEACTQSCLVDTDRWAGDYIAKYGKTSFDRDIASLPPAEQVSVMVQRLYGGFFTVTRACQNRCHEYIRSGDGRLVRKYSEYLPERGRTLARYLPWIDRHDVSRITQDDIDDIVTKRGERFAGQRVDLT